MTKAVGMLSGGLDSTLAAKLMIEQGIEVHAINFTSPFCTCTAKSSGCSAVVTAVRELGDIPLHRQAMGIEYLEMIRAPRHGYGRGLNPCIDCRIMKIKKAGEYMRSIDAQFLFTGEVLGQRPMSQHRRAIEIIDKDSGLQGLILRPLSAQHFEPTVPEQQGLVDRSKLLKISGRGRREQIDLAEQLGIADYPCPAGGCRLTDINFAHRLRDYFAHCAHSDMRDMPLLKIGRHFRLDNGDKVIVAHDGIEGQMLLDMSRAVHTVFDPQFAAPVVLLEGTDEAGAFGLMLRYAREPHRSQAGVVTIRNSAGVRNVDAAYLLANAATVAHLESIGADCAPGH